MRRLLIVQRPEALRTAAAGAGPEQAAPRARPAVSPRGFPRICARLVANPWFERVTLAAILANAVVLGLETYPSLESRFGGGFDALNSVVLALFTVELLIRIAAVGFRPRHFFRSGWNVFDTIVVVGAYLPGVRENVTLLRMARLMRVLRLVNVLPEMRVVTHGLARSLVPMASIGLVTLLFFYLYAVAGWILFSEVDPQHWRTVGRAMLTLFSVLTLEEWVAIQDAAMEAGSWAWVYFVTFVLLSSVMLLNLVVAVVINGVDQARVALANEDARVLDGDPAGPTTLERLAALRLHLDELESDLRVNGPSGVPEHDT